MSLKKRLLNNGIASVLQKGVKVLEQLFLVPFFISAWGAEYYGEWLTLTIIPSVIAFSNMGFGTSAANSFVLSYAAGEKQTAANISKTGIYIITLVIILGLIISVLGIVVLDYFQVFDKSLIARQDAIVAIVLMILSCLLSFYDQLIEAYYRAAKSAALSINLLSLRAGLKLVSGLVVLLLGYGIVEFAFSQLLITIFFSLFFYHKGIKTIGLFKVFKGAKSNKILKEITGLGFGYMLFPAWQAIYFQGSTFVVRVVLGAEAVAVFNTVRTLSRSVNQLLNIISSSTFPELQYEIGHGNISKAQKIYRFTIISSFLIALFGVVFLTFFGLWFYQIWTQNELSAPPLMWYLFVIGILFHAFWWSSEPVFRAKNRPYRFALAGVFSAMLSVIVTYFFSKYFGLIGSALGTLTLEILMAILILPFGASMLNMSTRDIFNFGLSDIKLMYSNFKKS